jgi:two-component system OmpR family sensor kinase
MLSRIPIRLRLTLAFAVAMAGLLAAMSAFVVVRVDGALTSTIDRDLRLQAGEVQRRAQLDRELLDPDAGGAASVAQIVSPSGAVLVATRDGLPSLAGASDRARVTAGEIVSRDIHPESLGHEWRILAFPVSLNGQSDVGIVGASLENRNETRNHILGELLIVGPFALALAALGGYLLAASALRPVEEMRRRAAAISGATPEARLPVPPADDEISRLATTLNETLERLDAALGRERRFVADASHELRTPLALMRTELELALRRTRSPAELEAAIRSASEETDRLAELAEDLLLLARSDAGELPLRRADVSVEEVIDRVVRRHGLQAETTGRRLDVSAEPGLEANADPMRLEQALSNLVDNALRHGTGSVTIGARADDGFVRLAVEDDGPGFPDSFVPRAFERFSRADEARGRGGSGLGLAIVDLIARSHGGTAGVESRAGGSGGATVWFTVPKAEGRAN